MARNASAAVAPTRDRNPQAPANGRTTPTEPARRAAAPAEETIRTHAFYLWEAAGRPDSDGVEFWLRAEQELTAPR